MRQHALNSRRREGAQRRRRVFESEPFDRRTENALRSSDFGGAFAKNRCREAPSKRGLVNASRGGGGAIRDPWLSRRAASNRR